MFWGFPFLDQKCYNLYGVSSALIKFRLVNIKRSWSSLDQVMRRWCEFEFLGPTHFPTPVRNFVIADGNSLILYCKAYLQNRSSIFKN